MYPGAHLCVARVNDLPAALWQTRDGFHCHNGRIGYSFSPRALPRGTRGSCSIGRPHAPKRVLRNKRASGDESTNSVCLSWCDPATETQGPPGLGEKKLAVCAVNLDGALGKHKYAADDAVANELSISTNLASFLMDTSITQGKQMRPKSHALQDFLGNYSRRHRHSNASSAASRTRRQKAHPVKNLTHAHC